MSLKNYFRYDRDNANFIPVEYQEIDHIAHTICLWIIGGIVLCGLGIGLFSRFAGDPTQLALREKNRVLMEQLDKTKSEIKGYQKSLKKLATDDNEIYRSVLGMKPIPQGEREGGAGGADIYSDFNVYGQKTADILKWTAENLEKMRHTISIQKASFQSIKNEYRIKRKRFSHIPAIKPASGAIISGFGMRFHPILKVRRMHAGVDFSVRTGTKVYATGDGVVKIASRHGTYGNLVVIDHGYGFETYYAHLSAFADGIRPGTKVKRGQKIALSGNTGLTTGPHLHYEIHKKGQAVDPVNYLFINVSPTQFLKYKNQAAASTKSMD